MLPHDWGHRTDPARLVKIGLMDEDFTPGDKYQTFVDEHIGWVIEQHRFHSSINTPEKARAYVNEHFARVI